MITAVDTSVLVALYRGEPDGRRWAAHLAHCRAEGPLCVCEVVAAEFFAVILDEREYALVLRQLGIGLLPCNFAAARLAGRLFRKYRDQGGPRLHLIPDFLIAAHAQTQTNRLAAVDRGYLRRYFADLSLTSPN